MYFTTQHLIHLEIHGESVIFSSIFRHNFDLSFPLGEATVLPRVPQCRWSAVIQNNKPATLTACKPDA